MREEKEVLVRVALEEMVEMEQMMQQETTGIMQVVHVQEEEVAQEEVQEMVVLTTMEAQEVLRGLP